MKSKRLSWIISALAFLVIFNALFYVLGGINRNASEWISYCFVHLSYLLLLISPAFTQRGESGAVFRYSINTTSGVYYFIELIAGETFILLAQPDYRAAFLAQLGLLALYAVILLAFINANKKTASSEAKHQNEIDFIKYTSAQLEKSLEIISENTAREAAEKLYDVLSTSPVKPQDSLSKSEMNVKDLVERICAAAKQGNNESIIDLAQRALNEVNERNRLARLSN